MLLDGIYQFYISAPLCSEISVEKPTKDFAAVRDRFEQNLIMSRDYFAQVKKALGSKLPCSLTMRSYEGLKLKKVEID